MENHLIHNQETTDLVWAIRWVIWLDATFKRDPPQSNTDSIIININVNINIATRTLTDVNPQNYLW